MGVELDTNIRDQKIHEALSKFSRQVPDVVPALNVQTNVTKDLSIVFLLLPEWDMNYVPYNLARLSAITEHAGYRTHVFDINVAAWRDSRNWTGMSFDPWNSNYMPKWFDNEYYTFIHDKLVPTMDRYVDKIVDLNPSVIGFTLYDCNREPILYMQKKLKERLPNLIFLLGGPICHRSDIRMGDDFDYIVQGEGEKLILQILEDIEKNGKPLHTKKFVQEIGERASLDNLPHPNYNHFNFNHYGFPNGATLEFSRGCIAKCVFCDETHFWKYRGRDADRVMQEISELYKRGVNTFWFLDSLVNGNLKELRKFCKDIIDKNMKIHWSGYARCDERMDLEYFKDLRESGCWGLSYGVESGSDKVLEDMNKAVKSEEIYNNFRDGASFGMESGCMIILGFPTEKYIDFYKTMELLWRVRNYKIAFVGGGFTCQISPETILGQDRPRYGVMTGSFENNWITTNFDNSKIHRMMRLKTFNIFLDYLTNNYGKNYCNRTSVRNHYTIKFDDPTIENEIQPEDFDFDICKLNTDNNLANTIINEVWPLLRILYRSHGGFEIDLKFDPEMDVLEFGPYLSGSNFKGNFKFKIDHDGNWMADFNCKYVQPEGAFYYTDYGKGHSNALTRIKTFVEKANRKIPISTELAPNVPPHEVFLEKYGNLNLSFDVSYKNTGKW